MNQILGNFIGEMALNKKTVVDHFTNDLRKYVIWKAILDSLSLLWSELISAQEFAPLPSCLVR